MHCTADIPIMLISFWGFRYNVNVIMTSILGGITSAIAFFIDRLAISRVEI